MTHQKRSRLLPTWRGAIFAALGALAIVRAISYLLAPEQSAAVSVLEGAVAFPFPVIFWFIAGIMGVMAVPMNESFVKWASTALVGVNVMFAATTAIAAFMFYVPRGEVLIASYVVAAIIAFVAGQMGDTITWRRLRDVKKLRGPGVRRNLR